MSAVRFIQNSEYQASQDTATAPRYLCRLWHKEHVRQDRNPGSGLSMSHHTRQPQGIPGHMLPVSCKNRSAHHSSYYSLSPGTACGYTILPDRKRKEGMKKQERGGRKRVRGKWRGKGEGVGGKGLRSAMSISGPKCFPTLTSKQESCLLENTTGEVKLICSQGHRSTLMMTF